MGAESNQLSSEEISTPEIGKGIAQQREKKRKTITYMRVQRRRLQKMIVAYLFHYSIRVFSRPLYGRNSILDAPYSNYPTNSP